MNKYFDPQLTFKTNSIQEQLYYNCLSLANGKKIISLLLLNLENR